VWKRPEEGGRKLSVLDWREKTNDASYATTGNPELTSYVEKGVSWKQSTEKRPKKTVSDRDRWRGSKKPKKHTASAQTKKRRERGRKLF